MSSILAAMLTLFLPLALAAANEAQCRNCHMQKSVRFIPKAHQPQHQHEDFKPLHGKTPIHFSCNNCHDAGHANSLRSTTQFPASFSQPSAVCQRCHQEVFHDWGQGLHGKRTGHWNGDKSKAQCTDCHNPHSVPFQPMKANPAPKKPKLLLKHG